VRVRKSAADTRQEVPGRPPRLVLLDMLEFKPQEAYIMPIPLCRGERIIQCESVYVRSSQRPSSTKFASSGSFRIGMKQSTQR
jgi:hypothetical protein